MRNRSKNFYPIVKTPFLTRLLTFFLSSFCIFFYFIKAVSKVESDSLSLTNWIQAARYLCSIHSCDHICRHSANSSERYIFFFRGIGKSFMQLQECEFRRHWSWRSQSVKELKEILYSSRHPLCSMKTWVPPEACNKKRLTFVSQLFIWT